MSRGKIQCAAGLANIPLDLNLRTQGSRAAVFVTAIRFPLYVFVKSCILKQNHIEQSIRSHSFARHERSRRFAPMPKQIGHSGKPSNCIQRFFILFCLLIVALHVRCALVPAQDRFITRPVKKNAAPWRIAFYQGGDYLEYEAHLRGFLKGLGTLGWISLPASAALPRHATCKELLRQVSRFDTLGYLRFDSTLFWSCEWTDSLRRRNRRQALTALTNGCVDLLIAMGTWAGLDCAVGDHSTPVVVMSTSDPVKSGILLSPRRSSHPHVYATCDPERYVRQINAFHNIVGFNRLGVVYEDSEDGRTYANLDVLRQAAEKRGFEVVACKAAESSVPESAAIAGVTRCYARLSSEIDALWIQVHLGEKPRFLYNALQPILENDIPAWSQLGTRAVRAGALLSISERSRDDIGLHLAKVAATILHGVSPAALPFVYEDPKAIAINRAIARRIGFAIPPSLLAVADSVYERVEAPAEDG